MPLDGPRPPAELEAEAGQTITPEGLGGDEALRIFQEVLARATLSVDNPRYLSFIPAAPTEASTLFDLIVGASSIYGGSWLEGAGAVYAENQALRWIADLAGLPPEAGGVFVQGGTLGQPVRAGGRPPHGDHCTRDGLASRPLGLRLQHRGALVDAARGARHGCRHPRRFRSTTTVT